MDNPKPFSQAFVMRTTAKHMQKSIDVSLRKTFERIKDFDGDSQKSQEVLQTLSTLNTLKTLIDDFQSHNKQIFTGE